jgi:serine/threonine-protein kinase
MVDPSLPARIGPFAIARRLGLGGMCEAYLAFKQPEGAGLPGEASLGPPVVIKRLLPHRAEDDRARQMLLREGRVGLRLNHENIVRYLDAGFEGESPWIAMEYLAGLSGSSFALRRWRQSDEDIPLVVAARIVTDAACGLHFAHTFREGGKDAAIVHRDISPDNLMVTREGVTKVLDFGIVHAEGEQILTKTGEIKGKMGYFPPELLEGAEADARSDIFSLGVTFYWLLTRRRPFRGKHEAQVLRALLADAPDPPSALRPEVPKALDELILQMLAKDPEQRTQSARDVVQQISACVDVRTAQREVGGMCEKLLELGRDFDDVPHSGPAEPTTTNEGSTGVRFRVLDVLDRMESATPTTQTHAEAMALLKDAPEAGDGPNLEPAETAVVNPFGPSTSNETLIVTSPPEKRLRAAFVVAGLALALVLIAAVVGLGGDPPPEDEVPVVSLPEPTPPEPEPEPAPPEPAPPEPAPPEVEAPPAPPATVEKPKPEKAAAKKSRKPKRPRSLSSTSAKLSFMKSCVPYKGCASRVLKKSKRLFQLPLAEAKRFPAELDRCVQRCLR